MFWKRYFGDRAFYRKVLLVAIPIMVQNLVTNLVNAVDNIMVGSLGTEAMSGVSIVNQFVFVFNLLVFGAISGAGIFTAQYHGLGDRQGVMFTFRTKFAICLFASGAAILAFSLMSDPLISLFLYEGMSDPLISLFLYEGASEGDVALTLRLGKEYLFVLLFGLLPFALSQIYASTLRETGKNFIPMIASVSAVATNCIFNYLLIFGKLGLPALGCRGAALATVISRFIELAILVVYTHTRAKSCDFILGAYRSFRVPRALLFSIAAKGLPLMGNEFFWSLAITLRNQCYATRGLEAVAAENIAVTFINLFSVVFLSLGQAVAIIVGNLLGAGRIDMARDESRKLRVFSVLSSILMGALLLLTATAAPMIYNTSDAVRSLATFMMMFYAANMPFIAYVNSTYFTIRSGGKVYLTVLFDSVYMWVVVLPIAFILSRLTAMDIRMLYMFCQSAESLKFIFAYIFVKKSNWAHRLVQETVPPVAETASPDSAS